MRRPLANIEQCLQRRKKLLQLLNGDSLVLASHPEYIRNGSVHHPYRADSNMYYLTGFEEPESVLVVTPHRTQVFTLFVRTKDPLRETWDGFCYGPDLTKQNFSFDEVFPIEELESKLPDLLKGAKDLYYRLQRDPKMDHLIFQTLEKVRLSHGRSGLGYLTLKDSVQLLGEMRVIKSPEEIEIQAKACEISSDAHREVMKFCSPGKTERDVHGFFIYQIMKRGAAREGYGTIVAGGSNACTLHYVFNDQPLNKNDLLLIDAGGEYRYQTADITRTYPISGTWDESQLRVYEGVLKIQKHLISMVRPGLKWSTLQEEASQQLAEFMLELGLLPGRVQDVINSGDFRKYYPHGVGHYLGLDVHDSGLYVNPTTKESRELEPGMILTIEPGLYIPSTDPSIYRGIGVRIEDDILVTSNGNRNLTGSCPKEVSELSSLIGSGASL
jgi:Xaa-Pro aminopeptidase